MLVVWVSGTYERLQESLQHETDRLFVWESHWKRLALNPKLGGAGSQGITMVGGPC